MICDRVVFFNYVCDVPTLASEPLQEELAKFGYRPTKKVQNFVESSYNLATCWTLLSKYGKEENSLEIW